jgi:anaerobic magnesium-protoporphyrin IX monomethyl ester cyclase
LLDAHRNGGDLSGVLGIAYVEDGKVKKTEQRPFIEDLDSLTPAWHLPDWSDYPLYFIDNSTVAILSSSRGCIHTCVFCSQHKFWQGTYRQRDPYKFVDEIEHLTTTYGINVFFIADEYPTNSRERWEIILDLLIKKNLGVHILLETCVQDIIRDADILHRYREAGILFIYVGVEATNDQRLQEFQKDVKFEDSRKALKLIQDAGMIVESSLILGTPGETPESISETLALAHEYNADFMHFLLLAPWPYADMYESLKPYIECWDYSKYNLVEPVIKPEAMTRPELLNQVLNCYKEYYMMKLPQWAVMKGNELKRRCLIKGMKAIIDNSFLKDHMKGLGGMPAGVKKMINLLEP